MTRFSAASLRPVRAAIVLAVALAACTGGYDVKKDGPLRVKDAWVRATNVTSTAALYLTLENRDTVAVMIVGAGTQLASAAEIHETILAQGTSRMNRLDSLPIARGATLTMKPGGIHIMLIDLNASMAAGDSVALVIHLADGRTTSVKAIARDK